MTQGNYYEYKTGAIASLPSGMTYNSDIARFVVNGKNFLTYMQAEWYLDYLIKFGFVVEGGFDPISLFASGEEGALFLPGPTTSFKSTTDLTPAGAGDTVGFQLDTSQGAGYSGGSFTGLGSELVTNGTFDSDISGWLDGGGITASWSSGELIGADNGGSGGAYQGFSVTAGSSYLVTGTIRRTGGSGFVDITVRDTDVWPGTVLSAPGLTQSTSNVHLAFIHTAPATGTDYVWAVGDGNASFAIDNISVRELPGNHATQDTAAARPVLARVPETGRRNLLTYSEQFDNAVWTKVNAGAGSLPVVTANAGTAPNGTETADRVQFDLNGGTTSGDVSRLRQAGTTTAASAQSLYVKSFDGSTYTISINIGSTTVDRTVTSEWTRIENTTTVAGSVAFDIQLRGARASANSDTADILIWGAQLEEGSTATAYQKVVSEYDVTEAGVDSLWYLDFDGVDDGMATASIDFTSTDKMSVFAAVEKLSDHFGMIVESSTNSSNISGNFGVWTFSPNSYFARSRGTVLSGATASGYTAIHNSVLSGLFDISGDTVKIRVNGSEIAEDTTDQGSGNYSNQPLYIGARGGTRGFLDGRIYGLIVRGATSTAGEISNTETFLAARSGVESRTEVTWDSTADTYTQGEIGL